MFFRYKKCPYLPSKPRRVQLTQLITVKVEDSQKRLMDVFLYRNQLMINSMKSSQSLERTFVFQDKDTQQSVIIDYELDYGPESIDLNHILNRHCPSNEYQVSIYDPDCGTFKNIASLGQQYGIVARDILEPEVILVRYVKGLPFITVAEGKQVLLQGIQQHGGNIDGRSKERTIGDVLEIVKKWRYLHYHGHQSLKQRPNLQQAANILGVSKKSLDDYYCQLRLGESFGFDFLLHLNERIGVLRYFVKDKRPERRPSLRKPNEKHPNKLRIIETYDIVNRNFKDGVNRAEQDKEMMMSIFKPILIRPPETQEGSQMVSEKGSIQGVQDREGTVAVTDVVAEGPATVKLYDFEHDFFKAFDVGDGDDPYFEANRDFWQKDLEVDSCSFMLME